MTINGPKADWDYLIAREHLDHVDSSSSGNVLIILHDYWPRSSTKQGRRTPGFRRVRLEVRAWEFDRIDGRHDAFQMYSAPSKWFGYMWRIRFLKVRLRRRSLDAPRQHIAHSPLPPPAIYMIDRTCFSYAGNYFWSIDRSSIFTREKHIFQFQEIDTRSFTVKNAYFGEHL